MANLNQIVVTIVANGQQYVSTLRNMATQTQASANQMAKSVSGITGANTKAAQSTNNLAEKIKVLGAGVVGNIARFAGYFVAVGALTSAIGGAVEEIREFDAQLRNIQSITLDTDAATRDLAESILKFVLSGESAGQSAADVAANMYQIVQAGYDAADALKIAEIAAIGASAGQTEAAVAGKTLVAILQAYKLPVEQASMVMSHLFTIVDKGVITFEELSNGLGYVVPTAAALGVTLSELGSAIELLTRQGQMPTRTMTNINQMLTGLLKPTAKLQAAIEEMGYSSGAAMVQQLGLIGTISALGKAAGVTDSELVAMAESGRDLNEIVDESSFLNAEASSTLAQWFGTVRAIRAILPLAADGGRHYNEMLKEHNLMALTGVRHVQALEQQQKSFNYQVKAATSNFKALFIILGGLVLPLFTKLLTQFNELFKKLVVVNKETGEMIFLWEKHADVMEKIKSVLEFIAVLIGVRVVFGVLGLAKAVLTLRNAFGLVFAIIRLLNPWALFVTVIIVLLNYFRLLDDVLRGVESVLRRLGQTILPVVNRAFDTLSNKGGAAFKKLTGMVKDFVKWFMYGFSGTGWSNSTRGIDQFAMTLGQKAKQIKATIGDVIKTVSRLFHMFKIGFQGLEARGFGEWEMRAYEVGKAVKSIFTTVFEEIIPNAIEIAGHVWSAFAVKIINDAKNVFNFLKGIAQSGVARELFASFMEGLSVIGDAVKWFAEEAVPAILDALQQFSNSDAGKFLGKVVGWLIEARIVAFLLVGAFIALSSPIGLVVVAIIALITAIGLVSRHWDGFKAKVVEVWNSLPGVVKFALETLRLHFESMFMMIKGIVINGIEFIIGTIKNGALLLSGVWNIIAGLWTNDWSRIWTGIKQVVTAAWQQIGLTIQTAMDLVKVVVGAAWNFIKGMTSLAWDAIKEKLAQAWEDIKAKVKEGIDWVIDTAKGLPGRFAEAISGIPDAIVGALGAIVEAGKRIGEGLIDGLAEGINGIGTKVERMATVIYQAIKGAMNSALRKAHQTIRFDFDGFKVAGKTIIPAMDFAFPLFQFYKGVRNFTGGMAMVGERGPELVYLPRGSSVATAPQTSQIMDNMYRGVKSASGSSGKINSVNAQFNVTADVDSIVRQLYEKVDELGRQLRVRSHRSGAVINGRIG